MSEKGFKFVPSRKNGIVVFNLDFVLLPAKVKSILKEQYLKTDMLRTCSTGEIEIILVLLKKVVALYIGTIIV